MKTGREHGSESGSTHGFCLDYRRLSIPNSITRRSMPAFCLHTPPGVGCSIFLSMRNTHQTERGVVYTDGKLLPPLAALERDRHSPSRKGSVSCFRGLFFSTPHFHYQLK